MALPILYSSDFTGSYRLSKNQFKDQLIQDYISEYEPYFIEKLLGNYPLNYIETETGATYNDLYTDLIHGVTYTDVNGDLSKSQGLKSVLKGLVYTNISTDNFQETIAGKVKNNTDNATGISDVSTKAILSDKYNQAVEKFDSVIGWMGNYYDMSSNISVVNNITGDTYQLTLDSTKYIVNGEPIIIDSVEYITSNVSGSTVEITTTNVAITGSTIAYWKPFDKYNVQTLKLAWL